MQLQEQKFTKYMILSVIENYKVRSAHPSPSVCTLPPSSTKSAFTRGTPSDAAKVAATLSHTQAINLLKILAAQM